MSAASKGFTLIELMIVVIVIGILAAVCIPMFLRMVDNAREASTKTNMHTVQVSAEDYGVQHDGRYAEVMDTGHLGNLLPPNFKNPFTGASGPNLSWENRESFAAPASSMPGMVSYADSGNGYQYNIKGYGKTSELNVVLTYGQ